MLHRIPEPSFQHGAGMRACTPTPPALSVITDIFPDCRNEAHWSGQITPRLSDWTGPAAYFLPGEKGKVQHPVDAAFDEEWSQRLDYHDDSVAVRDPLPGVKPPPGLSLELAPWQSGFEPAPQLSRLEPAPGLSLEPAPRLSLEPLGQRAVSWSRLDAPAAPRDLPEVPPPPTPVAVPDRSRGRVHQFSVGSVGHPHRCGEACRYVKRRGGCREGTACKCCHICFWQRKAKDEEEEEEESAARGPLQGPCDEPVAEAPRQDRPAVGASNSQETANDITLLVSAGSLGHPVSCGNPCKYVRRKGGCRDGANCPYCHVCQWYRKSQEPGQLPAKPASEEEEEEEEAIKNVGGTVGGFNPADSDALVGLIRMQLRAVERDLGGQSPWRDQRCAPELPELPKVFPAAAPAEPIMLQLASVVGHVQEVPAAPKPMLLGMDKHLKAMTSAPAPAAPTLGSMYHPHRCGPPCKYSRRKGGCRDGAQCPNCHLCQWTRAHALEGSPGGAGEIGGRVSKVRSSLVD